jgi:hypothetical protein
MVVPEWQQANVDYLFFIASLVLLLDSFTTAFTR